MKYVIILIALLINTVVESSSIESTPVIKDIIWAADKVEIPRELLLALCWGESTFRTDDRVHHMDGGSYSYGICQVKLATAQDMDKVYKHKVKVTVERLKTPKVNAFYAAKYLRQKLIKYHWNWQLAVDAYNKGNALGTNTQYVKRFNRSLGIIKTKVSVK